MHKDITYEQVRKLFRYDSNSGELFWEKRTSSMCKMNKPAGNIGSHGYRTIMVKYINYLSHRLVWLYHYGYFPENEIDHIDQNKLNNHINNLREVSSTCNSRNCGNRKDNISGVKGVVPYKSRSKWRAHITVSGKMITLGYFVKFVDAVMARYEKEKELNWNICDTKSPAFQYLKKNGLLPA